MSEESDTLQAVFQEIFEETSDSARVRLIERVLVEHHTVFTHLARQIVHRFGISPDWYDEVQQIVRTEAWRYLSEPLKPGFDVKATMPCIRVAARAEVQRMRQSSAYTGISGAVSARRRESAIAKHRMDLIRTLGWEPDDQFIIDSYNEKVTASRSAERARTQGALVTKADLELPTVGELEEGTEGTVPSGENEVEVKEVLAEILRRCQGDSEHTGQVAQVVLGGSLGESVGEMEWSARHVSKHVELSSAKVSHLMHRVRAIAVEVVDEWGIAQ
ncbi:hypothetical protein [Ornithinimicrobium murale]|uniref:hypothetical protein n=1 Tax=Ornithinimicrobium murale TaxID=1050153 RepID=UPI000E0E078B|nr:hypothetical protein [Ornithinimicrobium murale]